MVILTIELGIITYIIYDMLLSILFIYIYNVELQLFILNIHGWIYNYNCIIIVCIIIDSII